MKSFLMTYFKKAYPYLLILFCGIALLFYLNFKVHHLMIGDGSEYYANFVSFCTIHRPWMEKASFDKFEDLYNSNSIGSLWSRTRLENCFPDLKVRNTADFNHFWFYSFLAYLVFSIFKVFGIILSPHTSFLMLHCLLFSGTAALAFHYFRWKGLIGSLLLLFASPILWNAAYVHTEFFTFSLTLAAIIFLMKEKYLQTSLCFAILSTQNPPFAIIAFLPFACHFIRHGKQPFSFFDVVLIVLTGLITLLHPVYYFFRYGVLSPQFLAGGANLGGYFRYWYVYLLDPDLGLLPQWSLGLALVLFLLIYIALHWKQSVQYAATHKFFLFFIIFFVFVAAISQTSSTNLNAGGCVSVQRYALWYIPLFFPILYLLITLCQNKVWQSVVTGFCLLALLIINIIQYHPNQPEVCVIPAKFSLYIQKHLPSLYDPPLEVYVERYSGYGETAASWNTKIIVGPDGHKALINPNADGKENYASGLACASFVKLEELVEKLSHGKTEPFYTVLTDEQLLSVQDVIPLATEFKPSRNQKRTSLLTSGWSFPETWGTWSNGKEAVISFPYSDQQEYYGKPYIFIILKFNTFHCNQHLRFTLMGEELLRGKYRGMSTLTIRVPLSRVHEQKKKTFAIHIEIPDSISPAEVINGSQDTRILGIALIAMQVDLHSDTCIPDEITFNKESPFFTYEKGFSHCESWGTWTDGETAEMRVALPENPEQYHSVKLRIHPFLSKNGTQSAEIKMNDSTVKTVHFTTQQDQEITLPMPKEKTSSMKLSFKIGEPVVPADSSESKDTRKLGIGLISLQYQK